MATTDKRRYTIPMLDRALRVLELLAPAPDGLSIAELSRQLAAPKSSVFNILATWAQRDYARVVEPTGKYVLTAKLYRVGSAALGQLAVIRRQGYALDAEEDHVGIRCVGRADPRSLRHGYRRRKRDRAARAVARRAASHARRAHHADRGAQDAATSSIPKILLVEDMMPNTIEFGWVVQPVPISQSRLSGLANIPFDATQRETLRGDIHKFLKLVRGQFKTAWLEDHFQWLGPNGSGDTLEGWTHMAYLMPQYPEFQFGNLVLAQSYRNPALQAKMAATLHALSGGRVILGIGAGWKQDEYRAYGYPYPSPGVRTAQLDEYTQIIRLMLAQSPASFTGKYYTIANAHNDPLPQTPIPLMIGGGGERGTLRTTAKYADWWNFPLGTADVFGQKVAVLKQHCDAVGRDCNAIVLSSFNLVSLSADPARVRRIEREVHTVGGNADEVTRELEQFVKLGARHFMFRFFDFPNTEGVELFLNKVLPRFR